MFEQDNGGQQMEICRGVKTHVMYEKCMLHNPILRHCLYSILCHPWLNIYDWYYKAQYKGSLKIFTFIIKSVL